MLRNQPWVLIVALGLFGMIRPVLSFTGVYNHGLLEQPVGPTAMTVLIGLVWIGAAVVARMKQPIVTLALTGVVYGIFAFVLNVILTVINFGDSQLMPLPGIISMIVIEALFGALCGLLATVFFRIRPR